MSEAKEPRPKPPTPQVGRTPAPTPTPVSRQSEALKTQDRTRGFAEAERERIPSENKQPGQRPGKAPAKKNGAASPSAEGHASRSSEREAEARDVQGPEIALEESLAELEKSTPMASSIVPPMSYFLDRLTADWVTGPGATQGTTLSQLAKPRGRVVIHASVSEDHGRYSPQLEKVTLDVAVLGAKAAELVKDAIGRRGLFGADIPVDLNVQVPNQVGGRGYRRVHMLSAGVPERVPFLPNGRPAFDAIMNDSGFWTQAATQAASNLQGGS